MRNCNRIRSLLLASSFSFKENNATIYSTTKNKFMINEKFKKALTNQQKYDTIYL